MLCVHFKPCFHPCGQYAHCYNLHVALLAGLQLLAHGMQSSTGTEASMDTAQRQSDSSMPVNSSTVGLLPRTYSVGNVQKMGCYRTLSGNPISKGLRTCLFCMACAILLCTFVHTVVVCASTAWHGTCPAAQVCCLGLYMSLCGIKSGKRIVSIETVCSCLYAHRQQLRVDLHDALSASTQQECHTRMPCPSSKGVGAGVMFLGRGEWGGG